MIRITSSTWGSPGALVSLVLGAAIIGLIAFGWWMNHIPARPRPFFLPLDRCRYRLLLVLLLMVLRLIWRGLNPIPALARGHAALATDGGEPQPLVRFTP